MAMHLTIVRKGMILLGIPLLFQLVFIVLVARIEAPWLLGGGLAGMIGLSFGLMLLFNRGISGRLAVVTRNARRLAQGEALAAPLPGSDEIAEFDHAFHDMANKLAASEAARREQTTILQAILHCMGDGVIVVDEHGKFLAFNPAAERIVGRGPVEASPAEWPRLYGMFQPDGVTPLSASELPIVRAARGQASDGVELFVRNSARPEGTWIQVNGRPLAIDGRLRGGVAVFHDIGHRKRNEQQLRQFHAELEQRVQERTAELAHLNRELTDKNKENEMFVYSVSHDLRSPLVNLEGFSKELALSSDALRKLLGQAEVPARVREQAGAILDGAVTESIHFIQTAVQRLSGIIDALLRLSRAGRVELQWQALDINALVGRVVESLRGTIAEQAADVRVGELPPVCGDPVALEQVFANLIGNALKYADPVRPPRIEVSAVADDVQIVFAVKDNGLGIAADYRAKIFEAFQRLHTDVAPGEGMGLAIVRRVVERHQGKVWVESEAGVGSTFLVALPQPWFSRGSKNRAAGILVETASS